MHGVLRVVAVTALELGAGGVAAPRPFLVLLPLAQGPAVAPLPVEQVQEARRELRLRQPAVAQHGLGGALLVLGDVARSGRP